MCSCERECGSWSRPPQEVAELLGLGGEGGGEQETAGREGDARAPAGAGGEEKKEKEQQEAIGEKEKEQ